MEARAYEVKYSRAEDASYRAEYEERMTLASKTVAGATAIYARQVGNDAERVLLGNFKKGWDAYLQAQQTVLALGRDNKQEDAADISDGLASTTLDEAAVALETLSKFNFDGGKAAAEEANRVYRQTRHLMAILVGVACAFGALLAYTITRSITLPIRKAVEVTQAVASGNLTIEFEAIGGNEAAQLLVALKNMNDSLKDIVAQVRTGADTISAASVQIAAGNLDLSSRTAHQAISLQQTASTMEEITSTVKQNTDNARQANQLAISASEVAIKGGAVVSQVVDTMESINASSKKIVDIIAVIDGVAFQTNILALNAAVEAARAGEQGRGFAVVASEVRNLAQRSAAAAKEIKILIGDSVDKVGAGTKLVGQAGSTMQEIVDSIRSVADIMGEITGASEEQTSGIEQINQAIAQMDEVTQQNAALVEEAAAAAGALQEQASGLAQVVTVFTIDATHIVVNAPARMDKGQVAVVEDRVQAAPRQAHRPRLQSDAVKPGRTTIVAEHEWEAF